MSKWKCNNCNCKTDDTWKHVKGFSHVMSMVNPKCTIINNVSIDSRLTDDEYLFLANCTDMEFHNFFIWNNNWFKLDT